MLHFVEVNLNQYTQCEAVTVTGEVFYGYVVVTDVFVTIEERTMKIHRDGKGVYLDGILLKDFSVNNGPISESNTTYFHPYEIEVGHIIDGHEVLYVRDDTIVVDINGKVVVFEVKHYTDRGIYSTDNELHFLAGTFDISRD